MKPGDLPKCSKALLLVDFINPLDFPEAEQLAPFAVEAAQRTAQLKKAARAAHVPVIYANDNFGNWTSDFPSLSKRLATGKGPSAYIAKALRPLRGDISVLKPRHSAFYGTPLDILLETIGARHIIITGLATDICVQLTAGDAFLRNYKVSVPENCTAAETIEAKSRALQHMSGVLRCDVAPVHNQAFT
ncbi:MULTISPECIES: isochorismatase family cysteine hydrolase [unclassified Acidovorax]|uniref:cysteine hydrolase family protein n=1 Tax=unclassified Acidovorax TaxID=2684926 RepID=UPI00288355AB|nr:MULTISPECIES: isochorismatase family cysteine hydrolase [unclassified Acidovorax]